MKNRERYRNIVDLKKYEEVKSEEKIIECNICNRYLEANQINIIKDKKVEFSEKGKIKRLWLTYYECPYCGHKYRITIDDENSLKLRREYRKAYARLLRHTMNNRKPEESQVLKEMRLRNKLAKEYLKINEKYDGRFQELATLNN